MGIGLRGKENNRGGIDVWDLRVSCVANERERVEGWKEPMLN